MKSFINKEIEHFRLLPGKVQKLIISHFFYGFTYPVFSIFINSYIWATNKDVNNILSFRLANFAVLPVVFIINGYLLKRVRIGWIFYAGAVLIGLSVFVMNYLNGSSVADYALAGAILGSGMGLYWANRSLLINKETSDKNRGYFYGLSFSTNIIFILISSFIVGWLIVLGLSYKTLMTAALILMMVAGFYILKAHFQSPKIGQIFIGKLSSRWQRKRLITLGIGLVEGLSFFVPSLIILSIFGNEGVLGTLSAISSVITALAIYLYGRKSRYGDHRNYFVLSVVANLFASAVLVLRLNLFTALFYTLTNGLIINFIWLTSGPLILNNIDHEVGQVDEKRYAYVVDSELFLDIGRCLAIFVCAYLIMKNGSGYMLRYSSFILAVIQVTLFAFIDLTKGKQSV